jgi:hypothetical protein
MNELSLRLLVLRKDAPMTIKNETLRREIRALIQTQIVLPNYLEDQLVQRRIGRLIAAAGDASANEKRWRDLAS